jgi:very-short-patch-repair endonuclease
LQHPAELGYHALPFNKKGLSLARFYIVTPSLTQKFEAKYQRWKERLLDIGAGNRLISFRPTKVSTVQISNPDCETLFERLVIAERALKFPLLEGEEKPKLFDDQALMETKSPRYKVKPGDLETSKSPPDLDKSLFRLEALGRASKEERGVNTLYVSLGMLEWRPLNDAGSCKAPLVLVPIELQRENRLSPYVMSPFDEDFEINPTLTYMLKQDFDLSLPDFTSEPDESSFNRFLEAVDRRVRSKGWRVLHEAWLAQFHFKKLAMYKDLDAHCSGAADNSLVVAVSGFGEFKEPPDVGSTASFDEISPSQVFTVLDADSTQMEAVLRARAGQDIIIQGPPGTGKSQTITNLISQFLLEGKRVLFVSEKMAALSVVHKRLEDVGISPFCLEIHSDKANKRDVLQRIGRAASTSASTTQRQARMNFDRLLLLRRELNSYVRTLHQTVVNGRSAFDLHGELAQLAQLQEIASKIELPIATLDTEAEQTLLRQARRLAQMPGMLLHYFDHPWFGCSISSWSMEAQAEMQAELELFVASIQAATPLASEMAAAMGVAEPNSIEALGSLLALAKLFSASPCPPRAWLGDASLDELRDDAAVLARQQARHHELKQKLIQNYSPKLFSLACDVIERELIQSPGRILYSLKDNPLHESFERNSPAISRLLVETLSTISSLKAEASELAEIVGERVPERRTDCTRIADAAAIAATDPQPTKGWFDSTELLKTLQEAKQAAKRQLRFQELSGILRQDFTEDFLALPLQAWKSDFRERHSGFLRFLSKDYRRSMKAIRATSSNKIKLSYVEALRRIDLGAEAQDIEAWFEERKNYHETAFGVLFKGIDTDWRDLIDRLERVQALLEIYRGTEFPDKLIQACLAGGVALQRFGKLSELIRRDESLIAESLIELDQYLFITRLPGLNEGADATIDAIERTFQSALHDLEAFDRCLVEMRSVLRANILRSATEISADAQEAREVQQLEKAIEESKTTLVRSYGHFFTGIDTDWDSVISALDWSRQFLNFVSDNYFLSGVLVAACLTQSVRTVTELVPQLAPVIERINNGARFLNRTFDPSRARLDGSALESCELETVLTWLQKKVNSIGSMSEWIQFQSLRYECERNGLAEFVSMALEMKIPADKLELCLRKRILTLQLDGIYEKLPLLRDFSWRDHEELILQFKELDRDLMRAYAELVKAAVAERQPKLQGPSVGQLGFLRRELAKQRRHAPLRKLFRECGEIIVGLAPCLLMSPLSVATFLPKDSVEFDVLIFDEASQIPSEEAIGGLLRCKQVIVAGDTKQLPPTRFFERSLDDGGDEYEEAEVEVLESLLEDCDAAGMQPCPLNWHYRSRHESLISFSNAEFYDNSLVTFPAPVNPAPNHMGVKLVHVQEGVYDRGRSRTNRVEAQRVAELVARHLDEWGANRSLLVIALSSAQKDAIEEEITKLKNERPDLEELLKRTGKEPFDVKPLENVQGDERDTIIISIGYGKDSSGTLSLNFGPINSAGGQRRLNVAVSRARWQTILVSSILAHDIDESRVTTSGPKILKRYLHFAKEGRLPFESMGSGGESESPFELAVYDALRDKGLEVDRQVGVSSYRIDLAIRDPARPGRYLLGVECDGASYHSAIVARDRDRLRQQILENLGWKIHRIWSTDWIRNRRESIQRILDQVERLQRRDEGINDPPNGSTPPPTATRNERGQDDQVGPVLAIEPDEDPYASLVEAYSETPTAGCRRPDDFYYYANTIVRDDVLRVVTHEGPVHQDVIVQRVARMYKLQRTGSTIEQTIVSAISSLTRSGKMVRKGKFLWPSHDATIRVRRANGNGSRPIQYVPPEEIEEAALLVLRLTRGVSRNELLPEIARVLGYARTGDRVERAALGAIRRSLGSGRIVERSGFLMLT